MLKFLITSRAVLTGRTFDNAVSRQKFRLFVVRRCQILRAMRIRILARGLRIFPGILFEGLTYFRFLLQPFQTYVYRSIVSTAKSESAIRRFHCTGKIIRTIIISKWFTTEINVRKTVRFLPAIKYATNNFPGKFQLLTYNYLRAYDFDRQRATTFLSDRETYLNIQN